MKIFNLLAFSALAASLLSNAQASAIGVYISKYDEQFSPYEGTVLTETFNSFTPGLQTSNVVGAIGTYNFGGNAYVETGASKDPGLQYGGANGSPYIAMGNYWTGNTTPYSVTLNMDANYFGFWFSAGDPSNTITFYKDGVALVSFGTSALTSAFSGTTLTAVDSSVYNTSEYFGNPNNGLNSSQPYAYVSFYSDVTFDEIEFGNGGNPDTGYESDNHSIYFGSLTPTGSEVLIETLVPVPEPGETSAILLGLGACIMIGRSYFRRTKQNSA